MQVNIGTANIKNRMCEKLLGIDTDWKLSFDYHMGNICKKACGKLNVLTRVARNNLRNYQEFTMRPVRTIHYGLNSLAFLGPII